MKEQIKGKVVNGFIKWTTLLIAISGLVLGIVNTYTIIKKDKVLLAVIPLIYVQISDNITLTARYDEIAYLPESDKLLINKKGKFAFNVINMSDFPLEIADVGFSMKKNLRGVNRIFIQQPFLIMSSEHLQSRVNRESCYPIKLDSREAVTFLVKDEETRRAIKSRSKNIYAHTTCGETFWADCSTLLNVLMVCPRFNATF